MLLHVILLVGAAFCWLVTPTPVAVFLSILTALTALIVHLLRKQPARPESDAPFSSHDCRAPDNCDSSGGPDGGEGAN